MNQNITQVEKNVMNSFYFVKEDIKTLEAENKELKMRLKKLEDDQRRILFLLAIDGRNKQY